MTTLSAMLGAILPTAHSNRHVLLIAKITSGNVEDTFRCFSSWRFNAFHTDSRMTGMPEEKSNLCVANPYAIPNITHISFDTGWRAALNPAKSGEYIQLPTNGMHVRRRGLDCQEGSVATSNLCQ
jgi:DNA segregation ATPase FtsK/SpoIIIE-like protein